MGEAKCRGTYEERKAEASMVRLSNPIIHDIKKIIKINSGRLRQYIYYTKDKKEA
jgi:hypothetical protein